MKVLIFGSSSLSEELTTRSEFEWIVAGRSEAKLVNFKLKGIETCFCDVTSKEQVLSVVKRYNPDAVVNTAAIKHIDFAERNPWLAIKVNVEGVLNILECIECPMVQISTDKAVEPCSIYGSSKFTSERVVLSRGSLVVRPPNIIDSVGNVIDRIRNTSPSDRPLEITSKEMERKFCSRKDVVELICYALLYGVSGDVFLPYFRTVRILDLFEIYAEQSGKDIAEVGCRGKEKLKEKLIWDYETDYLRDTGSFYTLNESFKVGRRFQLKDEKISKDALKTWLEDLKLL